MPYQPKTGKSCFCKPGNQRDNCPTCEGTGEQIDFKAIREKPSLYQELKNADCEIDSHESDLYVKVSDVSREIVKRSGRGYTCFTHQVTKEHWYDVSFCFDPWWEKRQQK